MKEDRILEGVYANTRGFWTPPTHKDLLWIGKRILYRYKIFGGGGWSSVREGLVIEFSPSKEYVKISYDWYALPDIRVIEVLPRINK